jgi:hydrogenase nickel incorporation protein HypA/HybF
MHELAICSALIDEIERVVRDHGARRAVAVVVRVGPLAGVEPALLSRAYSIASAGTAAAGAKLLLEQAPVSVRCRQCAAESGVPSNQLSCPRCGCLRTELVAGEELLLTRVELERDLVAEKGNACHV